MEKAKETINKKLEKFEPVAQKISLIKPKHLLGAITFGVLAISLPSTLILLNQRQDLQQSASETTTIARLEFSPSEIVTAVEGEPIRLSVLAYNGLNQPISENVLYQWGISSTNSVGTLTEVSGAIATFLPQNIGFGDIFVTATGFDNDITQSIRVNVTQDGNPWPTPTSDPTPTQVITPYPTSGPTPTQILTPTPTFEPTPTPTPEFTGFRAEYYPRTDFRGDVTVVEEEEINHDWGRGAPLPGFPDDGFSVRWTKTQYFEEGRYEFSAINDDGMRVYIDGRRYYYSWRNQGSRPRKFIVRLSEGNHDIRVDYYEFRGNAEAKLSWEKLESEEDREQSLNSFLRRLFERLRGRN